MNLPNLFDSRNHSESGPRMATHQIAPAATAKTTTPSAASGHPFRHAEDRVPILRWTRHELGLPRIKLKTLGSSPKTS
jgi:hypothetical protein